MLTGRDVDLQLNIKEVYRYLGYRGREPEEEIKEKIADCIKQVLEVSELRGLYEELPLVFSGEEGELSIGGIKVKSFDLWKNLSECSSVYLLGATIGIGIDRLIARASVSDMTRATIYQAVGAAYVEEYVDYINEEIRVKACGEGLALRPRFSPGYGDLPLDYQQDIFRLLNLSKHIGISLTESMLMSPSKSVTAIIGVGKRSTKGEGESELEPEQVNKHRGKNCKLCPKLDCQFREE